MAPTRRILGASPPSYGCEDEQFTTELHHGGFFSGVGSSRIYLDEKVDWFDYCDSDTWSSLWLDDFIEQLGYDMSEKAKVYWLLPGKTFSDGLRRINSDASTNSMVALAPRFRTLLLYMDHQDILESINWDDVALSTPASIQRVKESSHCGTPDAVIMMLIPLWTKNPIELQHKKMEGSDSHQLKGTYYGHGQRRWLQDLTTPCTGFES